MFPSLSPSRLKACLDRCRKRILTAGKAHTFVADPACTSHPLFAVLSVAARILTPSVMQCPPVAVAVVVLQVRPFELPLVRISPFVLRTALAPVAAPVRNSVPVTLPVPLLAVFQVPQIEHLALLRQTLQPVLPVRRPGSVIFGTGFLFRR